MVGVGYGGCVWVWRAAVERGEGLPDCGEADAGGGDGFEDGLFAVDFHFDFAEEFVGAGVVGFVDDEEVGDFHDAGLDGLDLVALTGDEEDGDNVGEAGDVDFILADADGLDEDDVEAGGVDDIHEAGGGRGEAAHGAAGGHGTDEDAGVVVVALHADAVAEEGAAGAHAGGVDGDDGDGEAGGADGGEELIGKGALAGAGGTGDADDKRAAGGREAGDGLTGFGEGAGTGQGAAVAGVETGGEVGHGAFAYCRAADA